MQVDETQLKIPVIILRVLEEDGEKTFLRDFVNLPFDPSRRVDSLLPLIRQHLEDTSTVVQSNPESFSFHKIVIDIRPSNVDECLDDLQKYTFLIDNAEVFDFVSPTESLETFSRSMFAEGGQIDVYELIVIGFASKSRASAAGLVEIELQKHEKVHASFWKKEFKEDTMDIDEDGLAHPEDEERRMDSATELPYLTFPAAFYIPSEKIMVRQEYKTCYEYIASAQQQSGRMSGMVVTGQPGIGKTYFLLYCLVRRLTEGLPTFFSLSPDSLYYHGHLGVRSFSNVEISSMIAKGTWALVDVGSDPVPPPNKLANPHLSPQIFFIQTTSPDRGRYYGRWARRRSAITFCMEPWAWDEIWAGSLLQNDRTSFSAQTLRESFDLFGGSARTVYSTSGPPNLQAFERKIKETVNEVTLDELRNLFEVISLECGDANITNLLNKLVVVRRSDSHRLYAGIDRIEIASNYIFKLLVCRFSTTLESFASFVIEKLKRVRPEASLRGYFHGAAVHRFLINPALDSNGTRPLFLTPMEGTGTGSTNLIFQVTNRLEADELPVRLRRGVSLGSGSCLPKQLSDEEYYIPEATNNAAFDAFFVSNKTLYVLQITVAKDHLVKKEDVESLEKMLAPMKGQVEGPWKFVCVVPTSEVIKLTVPHGIAKKYKYYKLEFDTGMDDLLDVDKDPYEDSDEDTNEDTNEDTDEDTDEVNDESADEDTDGG